MAPTGRMDVPHLSTVSALVPKAVHAARQRVNEVETVLQQPDNFTCTVTYSAYTPRADCDTKRVLCKSRVIAPQHRMDVRIRSRVS